jgi:hypothetical protein
MGNVEPGNFNVGREGLKLAKETGSWSDNSGSPRNVLAYIYERNGFVIKKHLTEYKEL